MKWFLQLKKIIIYTHTDTQIYDVCRIQESQQNNSLRVITNKNIKGQNIYIYVKNNKR